MQSANDEEAKSFVIWASSIIGHSGFGLLVSFFIRTSRRPTVGNEPIEYSVDERRRLGAAEPLGELHGLVDCRALRRAGVEDFISAESQNVSVGCGHAVKTPILSRIRQRRIQL